MIERVLIVDDSLTVRMDLAEAFREAGFEVAPCATAAEARAALAGDRFGLIVLDVILPDADGIDLLQEFRAAEVPAPIMLLSTESAVRDRIRGLRIGADEYVGKPYDRNYVVSRARELMRKDQGSSGASRATVLVIDDSEAVRRHLEHAFRDAAYDVLLAASGEEGLRIAADARPAVIIVDGQLPGIDGPTVIRRVRLDAALRKTPCLLLTASEGPGAELEALDAGADAFVRKDDDVAVILARVAAVLRGGSAGAQDSAATSVEGPKKILAVDDSQTYLQSVAAALRGEGYDVVLAGTGEEALDLLSVQSVECVLLDLIMPGLGGRETCQRIKAVPGLRDLPVIILTAVEDREAMIEGLAAGADDFIAKSSDFEVLRARVRAQIRRRQFESENRHYREHALRMEMDAGEARAARKLAETRAALVGELEEKNRELEAFSYSVSHDLRAPLRSIDGFSKALLEDYAERLDDQGRDHLGRVRNAAQRMGELIDDLLELSRVGRSEIRRERVDLSALAHAIAVELQERDPDRRVRFAIHEGLFAEVDLRLTQVVFENLLGNAWKFTQKADGPTIEFGALNDRRDTAYFVRDNGAGFDMQYAGKLFAPFQRLHSSAEFPGTGIGLATVQRVVGRHGGRVWAEGSVGKGATFFWTLPAPRKGDEP
jgi:two-component system, NtrC family, sensor kinase